jgi:conjugative relaxase-like TrwC/TraI family protein
LLWLESRDRAALEWAHHDAVGEAMQCLLAMDWTARSGAGGTLRQPVSCPPVAAFLQLAARPSRSEEPPMPHMHSQIVICNLAERSGRWGAVELREVFIRQKALGQAYHAALGENLARQGVPVERGAQGLIAVAGYERRIIETFSRRARDINEAERVAGGYEAALHARIGRRTRGAKPRDADLNTLIEHWQAQLAQARADRPVAEGYSPEP